MVDPELWQNKQQKVAFQAVTTMKFYHLAVDMTRWHPEQGSFRCVSPCAEAAVRRRGLFTGYGTTVSVCFYKGLGGSNGYLDVNNT